MSKKIGLAFEGGGGKGAYQIGVWKALHEVGFDQQIAAVSGTSIGAMNAFLFAYGDYDKAEDIWLNLTPNQVFSEPGKNLLPWNIDGGVFSRSGVEKIFSRLNFNRVNNDNPVSCYATCLCVDDEEDREKIESFFNGVITGGIILSQFGNPLVCGTLLKYLKSSILPSLRALGGILGLGDIKYFKINEYVEEIKKEILLASSAIPVVFPEHPIEGSYYIDGGLGDNLPVKPLFTKENCDRVILVHCNRETIIPAEYKEYVDEIVPLETQFGLLGTFDFSNEGIERRINQGYHDAVQIFEKVLPFFDSTARIINAKQIFDLMLKKSYERDKSLMEIIERNKELNVKYKRDCKSNMNENELVIIENNFRKNCLKNSLKPEDISDLVLPFSTILSANKARLNEIKNESRVERIFYNLTGKNEELYDEIMHNDVKLKKIVRKLLKIIFEELAVTREDFCRLLQRCEDYRIEFTQALLCFEGRINKIEKRTKLNGWLVALDNKKHTGNYVTEYKGQNIKQIPSFLRGAILIKEFYDITQGYFDEDDFTYLEGAFRKIFGNDDIYTKKLTCNEIFEAFKSYAREIYEIFIEKITIEPSFLDAVSYRPPYFTILVKMTHNHNNENKENEKDLLPQVFGYRKVTVDDLVYDFLLGLHFVDANFNADEKYEIAEKCVKDNRIEDAAVQFWQLINSKKYFDKANAFLAIFFHEIYAVKESLSLTKLGIDPNNDFLKGISREDIDKIVIELLNRGMNHSPRGKYCSALYALWYDVNNESREPDNYNLELSDDILDCYINGLYYDSKKNKATGEERKKAKKLSKQWYTKNKDSFKLAFLKCHNESNNVNRILDCFTIKSQYGDVDLRMMIYRR